ncbi:TadE/TadG family type IV pilus assembly protein [Nostocoides sp. Soil756]|jgi:Flp pilus assembly protein TadG|uniref:TadE/TadG family type IV pilus assembly protein n=1 Tax=Nostocoides sp. Soil756 TaxID=1736399 RepID=UPI0006FA72E4|nr:TadE/TadG family type IV pilus assembly protein [Tetrasphaera sp. Soil756]KRE62307.1 hypothetical protein ASG78_04475 [Tetrasphaera sp. Soil756]
MTLYVPEWVRAQGSGRRLVDEQGASAVEFALVLPVLILVIGAIIDFGFIFAQQISFNTSVRDAARAGVVTSVSGSGLTCGQIATQARNATVNGAVGVTSSTKVKVKIDVVGAGGSCSLPAGSASVSGAQSSAPCTGSAAATAPKSLQVKLTYASAPPFPVPFMGTVTLASKGDFQCEYS